MQRLPKHVSLTWNPILTYDWVPPILGVHSALLIFPPNPVPAPEPFWPYIEMPTTVWWPTGALLGKHNLTESVLHIGFRCALKGHDCGPYINHIPTWLEAGLCIVHTLMATRTVKFASGECKCNGTPVGSCTMIDMSMLPTPMMPCGGPPLPLVGTGTANFNSCIFGMHIVDFIAGALSCVIEAAAGFALAKFLPGNTTSELLSSEAGSRAASGPVGTLCSNAEALVHLAGQEFLDYRGDATISSPVPQVGPPGVSVNPATLTRSGEDGSLSGSGPSVSLPSLPSL